MEQRSQEWFEIRRGIPTASNCKKIITSAGRSATGSPTYMNELLAEWMGAEKEAFETEWMVRGTEMEPQALAAYEFTTDRQVESVGFITALDGMTGCSPDGMMEDRGLEIKCPKASTHIKYLLAGKCPADYIPQVQGSMFVTGKNNWDFMSFHPDLPMLLIEVERDEVLIKSLEKELIEFIAKMKSKRALLEEIAA